MGETLGCRFLESHGLLITHRNLRLPLGEVDVICRDGCASVVVEIRTTTSSKYPLDAIDRSKRSQLIELSRALGIPRIDLVGVGLDQRGVIFHWAQGVV